MFSFFLCISKYFSENYHGLKKIIIKFFLWFDIVALCLRRESSPEVSISGEESLIIMLVVLNNSRRIDNERIAREGGT